MARIGFRKAKYNLFNEAGDDYATLTGGKVPTFEKVIDEKFAPTFNNAELYAGDVLAESDYSFVSGQLDITVADDEDTFISILFGNEISAGGEVAENVEHIAPFVGYGHVIPKVVNGVRKYKVEFFPKVKFNSKSSEATTKGETVDFKTTSLSAKVFALDKDLNKASVGDYEKHQTFATLTEAETYLDGLLTPAPTT